MSATAVVTYAGCPTAAAVGRGLRRSDADILGWVRPWAARMPAEVMSQWDAAPRGRAAGADDRHADEPRRAGRPPPVVPPPRGRKYGTGPGRWVY